MLKQQRNLYSFAAFWFVAGKGGFLKNKTKVALSIGAGPLYWSQLLEAVRLTMNKLEMMRVGHITWHSI